MAARLRALRRRGLVLNRFGDYVESLRAQAGIPGLAAAIVGTNDILWEGAFGLPDTAQALRRTGRIRRSIWTG